MDFPRSDPPLGPSLPPAADATLGAADDARRGIQKEHMDVGQKFCFMGLLWEYFSWA